MTGLSEILLLLLLLGCVIILPGMFKGGPAVKKKPSQDLLSRLNMKMRVFVVLSVAYPLCAALYLQPWNTLAWVSFFAFGLFPVLIFWGIVWVFAAKKR